MVVILSPRFDLIPGIGQGQEPILVQALRSEFSVERLYERVISGFARSAEVQFDLVEVGPLIHGLRSEFATVVDLDRLRLTPALEQPIQYLYNIITPDALTNMQGQALTTEDIHYR